MFVARIPGMSGAALAVMELVTRGWVRFQPLKALASGKPLPERSAPIAVSTPE
jgi:hypothetical protein